MGKWLLAAGILTLGAIYTATEVEARRIGGGRSIGAQRNVTAPPAQTPAKPAQQQSAQGQQQGAQPAAAAPAGSRWGGILGGLAIGGLLGYFLGSSAGNLIGLMLIGMLVAVAVMVLRAYMGRREHAPQAMQYAGMRETASMPPSAPLGRALAAGAPSRLPAGFDAAGFLRAAKVNFLKLQAAHDAGRLEEIREFTTDELYEELKKDFSGRQETEVAALEADVIEFATEGDRHWLSVRFAGTVREAPGAAPEAFSEVWNLVKPADGSSGWLLAGIQQMH